MTDTPETEAASFDVRSNTPIPDTVVYASFAGPLERERNELLAKIAEMKQTGDEMAAYISIVGDFRLNREGYHSSEREAFEDWKRITS